MNKQDKNDYDWYEVVGYEEGLIKKYRHYAWAYKFANKLILKGVNVEIVGVKFDKDFNVIRKSLICC